ncbi:hypothetical protein Ahia01_000561300, partial [Argonauta hians]
DQVVYELSGTVLGERYFNISATTGTIQVKQPLTQFTDKKPVVVLIIKAYWKKNPTVFTVALLTITIIKNLEMPYFRPRPPYETSVNDYDAVGTLVFDANATDTSKLDPKSKIYYSLEGSASTSYFIINPFTGVITISRPLTEDLFQPPFYLFNIIAMNQDDPKLRDTAPLKVIITRNDNAPQFSQSTYRVTIPDSTPILRKIFRVTAIDSDPGKNGEVRYKIIGTGESKNLFEINGINGVIRIRSTLAGLSKDRYTIYVEASDSGSNQRTSTAQVIVTITRSNKPYFTRSLYSVTVGENTKVDSFVFQVSANDPNQPPNQLQYEMVSMVSLFVMSSSGEITVAKPLIGVDVNLVA